MSKRTRNRFTSQEKVATLRLHLPERAPVSDLCDQHRVTSARGCAGERLAVDRDPASADQSLLFLYARSAW